MFSMLDVKGIPEAEEVADLIDHLRHVGSDTRTIEVKTGSRTLPKSILHTLSSFSNTEGGLLVLGLDEEAGFIPTPNFQAANIRKALEDACAHRVRPAVHAEIEEVPFEDTTLLLAWIPELPHHQKPCHVETQGRYAGSYKRLGDGDHKLTHYEIDRLIENQSQPIWDKEPVLEAFLEDLNPTLVNALIERERFLKPRNFAHLSDTEALRRLNVIDDDREGIHHPTLAGLLALGEYPQQFFPRLGVTFTAYPGTDKTAPESGPRFLHNRKIDGPIPMIVEETLRAVAHNTRMGAVVVDGFRQDLPDYPPEAVREAVVNALMHRDYSPEARGSQVQVNLYADRLEILNPGGLYGIVTIDSLGSAGLSSTRNQVLSNLLESTPFERGFVAENRGSGYQAILTELQRATLPPPVPANTLTYFSLTFPRRRLTPSERTFSPTKNARESILDFLATTTSATPRQIADTTGFALGTIRAVLRTLVSEGAIEAMEPARSPKQRYRLHQ